MLIPPETLRRGPFRGSRAVSNGVLTRAQLRSSAWIPLLRDVFVHRDVVVCDVVRLAALRLVAPRGAVAHGLLAAWLHGVWVPAPGRPVPLALSLPVLGDGSCVAGQHRRRLTYRPPGELADRLGWSSADDDVVDLEGLRVTSPLRTCFDLMRDRRLVEAVVVADAFLAAGLPDWQLAAYLTDRRRWPGIRTARTAAALAHAGSRSPGETRLRMVVVLAGFPEPWVNCPVVRDGFPGVLAVPDLLVPGKRPVGLEYDGGYHDDPDQWSRDRERSNLLTTVAGLPLLRYDRHTLRDRRRVVQDIAAVTGIRPAATLDDADFWHPPPARAW